MRKQLEKQAAKLGLVGASAAAYVNNAMAAIDLTKVQDGINGAVSGAEGVGALVVGGVAALVVIGLIIGIVRKL